jgi:4-amino-4-deoxy-L-arabinose transferase-like glycosyltransferase
MLFLAAALVLVFALLLAAPLGLRSRSEHLSAWFLLAWADIVLSAQATSLLGILSPVGFLGFHAVLAAAAVLVWRRAGSPDPFAPLRLPVRLPPFREHPWVYLLGGAVLLGALVGLALVFLVPPNTVDSMTYHLARVGYWAQQGSFTPWPTNNPRQTSFPINAEIGLLWLQLFSRSERLAGLVQWFACLAAAGAVYATARGFGAARPAAFFSAAVWAALPQIVFQSTSTQNDLAATAFFALAVQFLLSAARGGRAHLLLSALALGLAIGAKTTVALMLPALALAALVYLLAARGRNFALLARWALACVLGFALLGAYIYVQNWRVYNDFFALSEWTPGAEAQSSRLARFGATAFIYAYQSVDFSGLPQGLAQDLQDLKSQAAGALIAAIPRPPERVAALFPGGIIYQPVMMHEDLSWFGPLGLPALAAGALLSARLAVRQRDPRLLFPILLSAGFYLTVSFLLSPTLYRGRYFVLAATAAAPGLAFLYQTGRRGGWAAALLTLVSLPLLGRCVLANPSKAILAERPFWTRDAVSLRTINRAELDPVFRFVETLPRGGAIALKTGLEGWDYPFFGPDLARRVVQVDPAVRRLDAAWLRARAVEYVVVEPGERDFLSLPKGVEWVDTVAGWTFLRLSADPAAPPAAAVDFLRGVSDPSGLVTVAPGLQGAVGVVSAGSMHWNIETSPAGSWLWMGEAREQGLLFSLAAEKETTVWLRFNLTPGPGLPDNTRTFRLLQTTGAEVLSNAVQAVDLPAGVIYAVKLAPGVNDFVFSCQDIATLREQPNGDRRPLLANLSALLVEPPQ